MIVVWRVTEHCNLSCPFCSYDRRLTRSRSEADVDLIRRFGHVLAEYQRVTGDRLLVSWMGGEPLRWRPLTELTTTFTTQLGLRVSTTTNGTPLGSIAVRQHLLAHYSELTVSVDAVEQAHEKLRGWPGGWGVLSESVKAVAKAKRLLGHGPRLRANVVLMRQTIAHFEQLCRELATWGIEEITFNQLGGRDRPEFFPVHRLLPQQARQLAGEIPALRDRLDELGVQLKGNTGYLRRILASTQDERIPIEDCHPGRQFLFINTEGIAAPCHFTTAGYGVPLQELRTAADLRALPERFAARRRQQRLAPCEDCQCTQVFEKFTA